jgi:hypothetical protein
MAGIMVFRSVSEALRAGFQVYDRTSYGYLVRTRTSRGWALAVVHVGDARERTRSCGRIPHATATANH